MSRTFSDCLESDCEAVFFNVDEFARTFTLSRGNTATTGVAAIVASREYETPTREAVLTDIRSLDFDVMASAYLISAVAVAPQSGDRFTDASTGDVYEVLPLNGRQCYEPMSDGLVLRVHVKQVTRGA